MENSYLNPEQQQAVLHQDGHLLIVAGPGTGKTQTLTHKIAYLLSEKAVKPSEIYAITFTVKAANELKKRLQSLSPSQELPFIGTFHALSAYILKKLDLNSYAIISEKQQFECLKKIAQTLEPALSEKDLKKFQKAISYSKNTLTPYTSKLPSRISDPFAIKLLQQYELLLQQQKLLDFDSLIAKVLELVRDPKNFQLFPKPSYLIIDEYQDINEAQYQLVKALMSSNTKICAIGDPDQAIYAFRGAKVEYFLRFQNDFPNATLLQLQTNYRSTQNILNVAHQLILNNSQRIHKNLKTVHPRGQTVALYTFQDIWKEANFIAKHITQLVGGIDMVQTDQHHIFSPEKTFHFSDIAVLCRTNHQARFVAEALKKENIPYQLTTSTPWHQKNEIQLVIAFLQAFQEPHHQLKNSLLQDFAAKLNMPLSFEHIRHLIETLNQQPTQHFKAFDWIKAALQSLNLENIFKDGTPKNEKRWQNLQLLLSIASQFDNAKGEEALQALLNYFSFLQNQDYDHPKYEGVAVMTLHAAKGLEFEVVFIPGLNDGTLPLRQPNSGLVAPNPNEAELIQEERRLFYVGITRAKKLLYLCHSTHDNEQAIKPSLFLQEIESQLKRPTLIKALSKRKLRLKQQMKLF